MARRETTINKADIYDLWRTGHLVTADDIATRYGHTLEWANDVLVTFPPPFCRNFSQHPNAYKFSPNLLKAAKATQAIFAQQGLPLPACNAACPSCEYSNDIIANNVTGNGYCGTANDGNYNGDSKGNGPHAIISPPAMSSVPAGADRDELRGLARDLIAHAKGIAAAPIGLIGASNLLAALRVVTDGARALDYLDGQAPDQRRAALEERKAAAGVADITIVAHSALLPPAAVDEGEASSCPAPCAALPPEGIVSTTPPTPPGGPEEANPAHATEPYNTSPT